MKRRKPAQAETKKFQHTGCRMQVYQRETWIVTGEIKFISGKTDLSFFPFYIKKNEQQG